MTDALTLSVPEAAQLLGVGRNHLYEMVGSGEIPHLRFGRRIRIPRSALEEWIHARAHGATGLRVTR